MTEDEEREKTPAYIARCKCGCGGIVMAAVDVPKYARDVAKEVAAAIRRGESIEHVTVGYVHQAAFGCLKEKTERYQPHG